MSLGGLLAFAALLIAGFVFATSAGNPGKQKEAKDRILAAFMGVIILLGSFILLRVINPQILLLENRITNVCDAGSCTLTPIGELPVEENRAIPLNGALLCDNVDCSGDNWATLRGDQNIGRLESARIGNDTLSIIKVGRYARVTLYENSNYRGAYVVIDGEAQTCTN